jgi:hypothetical protein
LSSRSCATKLTSSGSSAPSSRSGRPAVAIKRKDTATPADQAPSSTAAVCQCGGSNTAARPPVPNPQPSLSRPAVRMAQPPKDTADSSACSPVASS